MILPETTARPHFGLVEVATALGAAAVLVAFTIRALDAAPLVPLIGPFLAASLEHHTT